MKKSGLIPLILSLFLLAACDDAEVTPGLESSWNPLSCTHKSSAGCGVDWFITFSTEGFPEDAQILLNDKVVIDECDPQTYWTVTPTSQIVEFKISDYVNLGGKEKISLRVYEKDCGTGKRVEHSYEAKQKYTVENSGNEKRILIKRN